MTIKDPKKFSQKMMILCILIGFTALAVCIVAVAKEQYIIAAAMGIVTGMQIVNYKKWQKTAKR